MHILFISSGYPSASNPVSAVFVRDQAKALQNSGHQLGILSMRQISVINLFKRNQKTQKTIINNQGINLCQHFGYAWFPRLGKMNTLLWQFRAWLLYQRYVAIFGSPDMVHAHSAINDASLARKIKQRYQIPYVLTEHSSAHGRNLVLSWQKKMVMDALQQADARIFVSKALAKTLEKIYSSSIHPWSYIPNIIENNFFQPLTQREITPTFIFLSIALLTVNKGYVDLIHAFSKAFKGQPIELRIGGDGDEKQSLIKLSTDLGINKQIKFLGQLTRTDVKQQMDDCDAFVLASFYETFGLVYAEAMARGKPVIATRCGGPESFVNKQNGLLIKLQDQKSLADGMVWMVKHIDQYNPKKIQQTMLDQFSSDAVVNKLNRVYTNISTC